MQQNETLSPVQKLVFEFKKAKQILSFEEDLSPRNTKVVSCLEDFFAAVMNCPTDRHTLTLFSQEVSTEELLELRKHLYRAECENERSYASNYANMTELNLSDLDSYSDRSRYRALVGGEVQGLRLLRKAEGLDSKTKAVFVGSGPMPMTAIDFYLQTGASVDCIDYDEQSIQLSSSLIQQLRLQDRIKINCCRGTEFNFKDSDIVYIAAMVGNYEEVIDRVKETAPKATLCLRSADGVRALIYRPADPNIVIEKGYVMKGRTDPIPPVKNVTLFFDPA